MTWRPADREDRHVAGLWAVCAGLALLLRPIWIATAKLMPRCAWHAWTGWPCPGCGTTRALLRLLHADPVGAFSVNPLVTVVATGFVAGGLLAPVWFACGGMRPFIPAGQRTAWSVGVGLSLVLNWSWLAVAGV